ncbi:MAG: hypothetical protein MMC33_004070 [Icmadophila ericetorum]|nr:hypothetical protein [Icmadophila ericetorum]
MALSKSTAHFRPPCEVCCEEFKPSFYCVHCDSSFCDTCWEKQIPHKPDKRPPDGPHEKVDRLVVERYRSILEPSFNIQELDDLHKEDEDTEWFGVGRNQANEPMFEDYGRYATLMAQSLSEVQDVRYPQLVSFVGQTGAGKSTVVKLLINHQDIRTNPTLKPQFPSPVVGVVDDNLPTSANVHLYADPETIMGNMPVLYADCEGLEGGESAPKAESHKLYESKSEGSSRSSQSHTRNRLHRRGQSVSRQLSWAMGDKEKSKREYAVTELYPKLLYTFSDVVVFVLRNSKTIESAVLPKLIGWALTSIEKSLGQPALPHVIIALNATDLSIDPSQWDVDEATQKLLSDVQSSINTIPFLQEHVDKWRANGRRINTTKDLLECYYSSVTVVRIPTKGRYMLIDEQVGKLHTQIVAKCAQSYYMKKRVRMLSNSDDLQLYLQLAFDHFSQNLDKPFNFIEMALKINPIPSDFSGNIVKLAVAIKDRQPSLRVGGIFDRLSLMVASCIMLDIHRNRRLGTPRQLLEDHYMSYCEQAFSDFCDRHWRCSFEKKGSQCVNFYLAHNVKGHQNSAGRILATGDYIASFNYHVDLCVWIKRLEQHIDYIQESKDRASLTQSGGSPEELVARLHCEHIKVFYGKIGSATNFISHSTCFCCLREIPIHPLICGHVICTPCVNSYGIPKGRGFIEMSECPLDEASKVWPHSCHVNIKPSLAGVRILSLDGGGVRGIVELMALKGIEMQLPEKIPIRNFFDLIVGTSTGGIIALAFGVEGWPVNKCIEQFLLLCDNAFTPREMHGIWGLEQLAAMNHEYSRYKTRPLEKVLKESFSEQALFGGTRDRSRSMAKVAVTATRETGQKAVLLANYNRPHENDDQTHYEFERGEKPENELRIWEAARATSAAPSYFKEYRSERNNRGYLDGALYHNNPVRVADIERRLIWPDTEDLPPDILLSIGTSCNNVIKREARDSLNRSSRTYVPTPTSSMAAASGRAQSIFKKRPRTIHMHKMFKMMKNRVGDILDTEVTWLKFLSDVTRGKDDDKERYCRINPNIGEDPPKLDERQKLPSLLRRMHSLIEEGTLVIELGKVARRLVASSFYLEIPQLPTSPGSYNTFSPVIGQSVTNKDQLTIAGTIHSRFPSDSAEIRSLGEYLKNVTTHSFQPYFIIGEKNSTTEPIITKVNQDIIQKMMMNAMFDLGTIQIPITNESSITTIALSIAPDEEFPISGFPRALTPKKLATAFAPTRSKLQRRSLLRHVGALDRLRDDNSSHTNESTDLGFPELQQLPFAVKRPIWFFLQEMISSLTKRNELVPIKLQLLAEATEDKELEGDLEANTSFNDGQRPVGPYGTILHAAVAIGNQWVVELQIKAGVDISNLDDHCWTALNVAVAQGHVDCAKLLLDHMAGTNFSAAPAPRSPDGLAKADGDVALDINHNTMTASCVCASISHLRDRIQLRSNHPIPHNSPLFYFEVTIFETGSNSIVGIGLSRIDSPPLGMPGWKSGSWGYHGDDGNKFDQLGIGIRYSEPYGANDVVGCGINFHTGRVFFTKNGYNLGTAFAGVSGMLFPVVGLGERRVRVYLNFGQAAFKYNLEMHNWKSNDTAATLRSRRVVMRPRPTLPELA